MSACSCSGEGTTTCAACRELNLVWQQLLERFQRDAEKLVSRHVALHAAGCPPVNGDPLHGDMLSALLRTQGARELFRGVPSLVERAFPGEAERVRRALEGAP